MKIARQNEEQLVDRLLRGQLTGRDPQRKDVCSGLDLDLATAYLEKSLTTRERDRYEHHLAECAGCRTYVSGLLLMTTADADQPAIEKSRPERISNQPSWIGRWIRQLVSGLAQPQWALAATAVLIAAVAIPVIMMQAAKRENASVATSQPSSDEKAAAPPAAMIARERQETELNRAQRIEPGQAESFRAS